eukprot:scaffold23471_cov141-Cylindrotheca_fusiformis.AAC.11
MTSCLLLSGENIAASFSMIPSTNTRSPGSSSVLSPSFSISKPKVVVNGWDVFCPPPNDPPQEPTDVFITWNRTNDDDDDDAWLSAEKAAKRLLHQLDPKLPPSRDKTHALSTYLLEYSNFCLAQFSEPPKHFKARIVATRGRIGTKCPQWHRDHVPVRWIQALVGPGCQVVLPGSDGIHWEVMNALSLSGILPWKIGIEH